MALKELLTDLSNFKYTDYDNAGINTSKAAGRHGGTTGPTPAQPPHPDEHSKFDDGVGFGVAPNDNPQSFDVRGYTITGIKTFDRPNQDAITIMTNRVGFPYIPFGSGVKTGPVDFLSGVQGSWGAETLPLGFSFNMADSLLSPGTPPVLSLDTLRHTIPEVGPSPSFTIDYSRYDEELGSQFNTVEGIISSQYTDTEKLHSSYGTQFHISGFNRSDMYITNIDELSTPIFKSFTRGSVGLGKIGLTSPNFNPFEFGTDLPYVISQITATGPQTDSKVFSNTPKLAGAYGSDFMTLPISGYNGLYMGSQGDIVPITPSVIGLGGHTGPAVVGGGVNYYGSLVSITPRGSIYRADDGTYQVPQSGINTLPPGGTSNIPTFDDTQITHNIPQITLSGPFGDEEYQSILQLTPVAADAHGSDFSITPLANYTSQFSSDNYQTDIDSGFDRDNMYIPSIDEPSTPVFNQFTRSETSLIKIDPAGYSNFGWSHSNFDPDNDDFFDFPAIPTIPYNIPYHKLGEEHLQPFVIRDIGDVWGYSDTDLFTGSSLGKTAGFINDIAGEFLRAPPDVLIDRAKADITRIAKFLESPKGILFIAEQFILQAFNPTMETKVWNPLSLGSAVPLIHIKRHAPTAIYGDKYTDALTLLDDSRIKFQSPLATVFGSKLPVDKRLLAVNPNKYTWPIAGGLAAAVKDSKKIEGSQSKVTGRAKKQSDGGIKDLFQKLSFNKYDSGNNVYLTKDGIMGTPKPDGPFGFLASLPLTVSEGLHQMVNASVNWGISAISSALEGEPGGWGSELEVEERQPPDHRFSSLEQKNTNIPISGPLLNSPLAAIMASYYPGMQGSYSFPTHISGDLWPIYGHDYQYPVTKGTTPLISGIKLDGAWGVSLARFATGDANVHGGRTENWSLPANLSALHAFWTEPLAQAIVIGDNFKENYYYGDETGVYKDGKRYGSIALQGIRDTKKVQIGGSSEGVYGVVYNRSYQDPNHDPSRTDAGSNKFIVMEDKLKLFDPKQKRETFSNQIKISGVFTGVTDLSHLGYDPPSSEYFPNHDSLITNETNLTLSIGDGVHLGPAHSITGEKYPQARPIQFYKISGDIVESGVIKTFSLDGAGGTFGGTTFGDRIKVDNGFQGDLYGPFRNTALTKQGKDKYFDSTGRVPSEPLVAEGDGPIYLGYAGSIGTKTTTIHNFGIHTHGSEVIGITDFDPSARTSSGRLHKRPSKIFGTEKHNQTIVSKTVYHDGGNIYSFDGSSYLKRLKNRFLYKGQLGHYSDKGELPTVGSGSSDTKFVSVGLGTDFQGDIFSHKDKDGASTTVFATDLYSDSVTYGSLYKKYEAVAETEPHQFQHTRLILDSKGEPQLTYSLAHLTSNLAAVDSKALQLTAGTTVPIKDNVVTLDQYKDFPWSTLFLVGRSPENFQGNLYGPDGRKRYGFMTYSENVSLPQMRPGENPIMYKRRLTPVQQKVWRRQRIDDMKRRIRDERDKLGVQGGSLSITTVKKVENGEETSKFEVITVEGADGKDVVIPTVVKAKVSRNDLAPQVVEPDPDATFQDDTGQQAPAVISVPEQSVNVLDKPDILTEGGAETPPVLLEVGYTTSENIEPTQTTPTGNQTALKRYKTLQYGDLGRDETKYGKSWASAGESVETGFQGKMTPADAQQVLDNRKGGSGKVWDMGNPGTPGVTQVYDPELGATVKLKGACLLEVGRYNTDLVDKINMHPYGKDDLPDGVDDFIKFKFFDLVNKKYIIFRATLSGISESLTPEWSSERYIGRPDSVHVYQGVDRSMSFEFMVVPMTKQELPILWEKLNYLVGLTYPSWKKVGDSTRMEAPFISLTIGDMYNDVPGFFSSLSVTVDDNSPWEIDDGLQLPHAINVSCEFTHVGQHALASQGTHYDFGGQDKTFLKRYNQSDGTFCPRGQLTGLMGDWTP